MRGLLARRLVRATSTTARGLSCSTKRSSSRDIPTMMGSYSCSRGAIKVRLAHPPPTVVTSYHPLVLITIITIKSMTISTQIICITISFLGLNMMPYLSERQCCKYGAVFADYCKEGSLLWVEGGHWLVASLISSRPRQTSHRARSRRIH